MSGINLNFDVVNQKGTPAFYSDIFANRPSYGYPGRVFISTDTGAIYEDTGTSWTLIADAGAGTTGTLQQVTTNGNTTTQGISITAGGLSSNQVSIVGGTASQFLKADGTLDSSTYLTTSSASSTYLPLAGGTLTGNLAIPSNQLAIGTATAGAPLDIHTTTGTAVQFNGTTTNNAFAFFQNAGTSKWRIGNLYNAGANSFQVYDVLNATARLTILNTGATTLNGALTSTSIAITGGTSAQFLKADGSVDSNTYLTTSSASSTYLPLAGGTLTGALSGTSITGTSLVKSGGTSAQILAADGSVITAGTNITISGGTISSSGGGGSITLSAIGSTPNANAATLTGSALNLEPASASFGGVVTTGTQTFAGAKTFSGIVTGASFIPTSSTIPTNGMYLSASNTLNFATNTTNKLTIDTSGNFGLGITPSAWRTTQSLKAIEYAGGGNLWGQNFSGNNPSINLHCNSYEATSTTNYIQTGYASGYQQNAGTHYWLTAPSGTAGASVTWTERMKIWNTGNVTIGTLTDAGYKLDVSGTGRFTGQLSASTDLAVGTTTASTIGGYNGITTNGTTGSYQFFQVNGTNNGRILANSTNFYFQNVNTGDIIFSTNTASPTDRLRILSTGYVYFGSLPAVTTYIKYNFNVGSDQNIGFRSNSGLVRLEAVNDGVSANIPIEFTASKYIFTNTGNVLLGTSTDSGQGVLQVSGGITGAGVSLSGEVVSATATLSKAYYHVFTGSTGQTLTLPSPSSNNYIYVIINNTANSVTIAAATSTTITTTTGTSVASITLIANARTEIIADGSTKYYQIY